MQGRDARQAATSEAWRAQFFGEPLAVTTATFVVSFPEFARCPPATLTAQLAHVEATINNEWGTEAKRDYVVSLALADALATSPWGRDARLVPEKAKTSTYGAKLEALKEAHACLNPDRFGTLPTDTSSDCC